MVEKMDNPDSEHLERQLWGTIGALIQQDKALKSEGGEYEFQDEEGNQKVERMKEELKLNIFEELYQSEVGSPEFMTSFKRLLRVPGFSKEQAVMVIKDRLDYFQKDEDGKKTDLEPQEKDDFQKAQILRAFLEAFYCKVKKRELSKDAGIFGCTAKEVKIVQESSDANIRYDQLLQHWAPLTIPDTGEINRLLPLDEALKEKKELRELSILPKTFKVIGDILSFLEKVEKHNLEELKIKENKGKWIEEFKIYLNDKSAQSGSIRHFREKEISNFLNCKSDTPDEKWDERAKTTFGEKPWENLGYIMGAYLLARQSWNYLQKAIGENQELMENPLIKKIQASNLFNDQLYLERTANFQEAKVKNMAGAGSFLTQNSSKFEKKGNKIQKLASRAEEILKKFNVEEQYKANLRGEETTEEKELKKIDVQLNDNKNPLLKGWGEFIDKYQDRVKKRRLQRKKVKDILGAEKEEALEEKPLRERLVSNLVKTIKEKWQKIKEVKPFTKIAVNTATIALILTLIIPSGKAKKVQESEKSELKKPPIFEKKPEVKKKEVLKTTLSDSAYEAIINSLAREMPDGFVVKNGKLNMKLFKGHGIWGSRESEQVEDYGGARQLAKYLIETFKLKVDQNVLTDFIKDQAVNNSENTGKFINGNENIIAEDEEIILLNKSLLKKLFDKFFK